MPQVAVSSLPGDLVAVCSCRVGPSLSLPLSLWVVPHFTRYHLEFPFGMLGSLLGEEWQPACHCLPDNSIQMLAE